MFVKPYEEEMAFEKVSSYIADQEAKGDNGRYINVILVMRVSVLMQSQGSYATARLVRWR
jgi:hypothetical protein